MTKHLTEEEKKEFADLIREVVREEIAGGIESYFLSKGRIAKNVLVGTSVIIGALAIIGGGAKALLGYLGFEYVTNVTK